MRESDWQFTPSEDREELLYTILESHLPPTKDVLCDFRSGGYRLLGDILMDLDEQNQDTAMRKYKGILKEDTAQMKSMMLGAMESQDYRQTLIRNCKSIIWPTIRHYSVEVLEQIDWDDAAMCAEALGKRSFILEVLPASALDLVIDRTAPEKKKGVGALLNEWEEFSAYTVFPEYKKDTYLGRFTLPMLLEIMGFQRILTILARGYLFRDGSDGYDRIEVARRALLAWCSLSGEKTKNAPDQETDPRLRVNFGEYAEEFPELVTPEGEGWLIRHVENIISFVVDNPNDVRKGVAEKVQALKKGFRKQWANKLRQMQVPAFASNTKGAWVLRFDDILADALELGPLQNKDFGLPEKTIQCISELTPKGVPVEASILLYKYYIANKEDDQEFVLLQQQNFNAWFGNTSFSQKWVGALNGKLIEKKVLDGVCKYRFWLLSPAPESR